MPIVFEDALITASEPATLSIESILGILLYPLPSKLTLTLEIGPSVVLESVS